MTLLKTIEATMTKTITLNNQKKIKMRKDFDKQHKEEILRSL